MSVAAKPSSECSVTPRKRFVVLPSPQSILTECSHWMLQLTDATCISRDIRQSVWLPEMCGLWKRKKQISSVRSSPYPPIYEKLLSDLLLIRENQLQSWFMLTSAGFIVCSIYHDIVPCVQQSLCMELKYRTAASHIANVTLVLFMRLFELWNCWKQSVFVIWAKTFSDCNYTTTKISKTIVI